MSTYRSSDTMNGPTIRRMRGKVLDVHAEHWWFRSSRCSNGDCVEVARAGAVILVQDSKRPAAAGGSMQAWSVQEWQELLRAVRVAQDPFSVSHVAVDVIYGGPLLVKFGLDRHEKQTYDAAEWRAFFDGARAGEFNPDKLSGPASVGTGDAGRPVEPNGDGFDQAATGAGEVGVDLPGPVPVAAEPLNSPAGRDLLEDATAVALGPIATTGQPGPQAGPSPVNSHSSSTSAAGRRDHDPDSLLTESRVLPETAQSAGSPAGRKPSTTEVGAVATPGQPGPSDPVANQEDASLIWAYDDDLGEPQDPGVDKGAARRAGQGPVFADRSGVEAGAGVDVPQVPVPAAPCPPWCDGKHLPTWPVHSAELGDVELGGGHELALQIVDYGAGSGPVVSLAAHDDEETWVIDLPLGKAHELFSLLNEAFERLGAAAPLVPTDGAS